MWNIIGKQVGQYEIVSQLDEGGMSNIYKARQLSTDRFVAIKILTPNPADPTFVERFLQEADIVTKLEHPHILPVYDVGEIEGSPYIVMRIIEGGTLYDHFHGQPFALDQVRKIITQIGDALDYAHSEGVVHRDIKQKNILVDKRDNYLLTDFGIAKDITSNAAITRLGSTVGTPSYMSPEQIQGDPIDGRSDIYALGILLFQLCTGYLPYESTKSQEILMHHLNSPVPSAQALNPALPSTLEQVIFIAMAKEPDDRFATAGEMVEAVQIAIDTYDASTRAATVATPAVGATQIDASDNAGSSSVADVNSSERVVEAAPQKQNWGKMLAVLAIFVVILFAIAIVLLVILFG